MKYFLTLRTGGDFWLVMNPESAIRIYLHKNGHITDHIELILQMQENGGNRVAA